MIPGYQGSNPGMGMNMNQGRGPMQGMNPQGGMVPIQNSGMMPPLAGL